MPPLPPLSHVVCHSCRPLVMLTRGPGSPSHHPPPLSLSPLLLLLLLLLLRAS